MEIRSLNRSIHLGQRPLIMGILNVTPDSFSDGGHFTEIEAVALKIKALIENGADIIDVGGESTRPYATPVSEEEELRRVLPAITCLRSITPDIPVSIDTTKAAVARQALAAGADIINDVSAGSFDPAMIDVACEYEAPLVLTHMRKTPKDMQNAPNYTDVIKEISQFLEERSAWAIDRGLDRGKIIIDPGIGFGKTTAHNLTILKHLRAFKKLGYPLLIGHSRKAFIGKLLNLEPGERDQATAMLSLFCAAEGADILRVHDVKATNQAVCLSTALRQAT